MRTAQQGDRVQVHFIKRFQDGAIVSSRSRGDAPLEVTIGTQHPRLPGLGLELLGASPGAHVKLTVPAERAYGFTNPERIRRLDRLRFAQHPSLRVGMWLRILDKHGRRRLVRIVEVQERAVVVDTNHPRAGQALELEIELIQFQTLAPGAAPEPQAGATAPLPAHVRVVALNIDLESLASIRQAFPDCAVDAKLGSTIAAVDKDWNPSKADLLILGTQAPVAVTLGLCRSLRSQVGRAYTPLVVLVPREQQDLVPAALEAGAHSCLILPINARDLITVLARARAGNQPGRHTLGLDRAQRADTWRDEGSGG